MKQTAEVEIILESRSHGRELVEGTDIDDELERADIRCWSTRNSTLWAKAYEFKGYRIRVQLNWDRQRTTEQGSGDPTVDRIEIPGRVTFAANDASMDLPDKIALSNLARHFTQSYLNDFFLIMNLAVPGACNFYSTELYVSDDRFRTEISLSSVWFELAILRRDARANWPAAKMLPIRSVFPWFAAVRSQSSQIPSSRTEKVLFSILHISSMRMLNPTGIVWLFYALETLFDTRAGENFRVLLDRICLLLLPTEKQLATLRKELRSMYDLRSAFVHGGLEVTHPMHNEVLDRRVDEKYERLSDVFEFGFSLLLVAVQRIIERKWLEAEFLEVLRGKRMGSATR